MRKNQIKLGAIISYLSIGFNILAGLLYTPWMVQQIGKSNYGLYTLATSLITLFLIDFGLSSATSRYVSKYVAEGKTEKVNVFLGAVYKLYFIIDAVIVAGLLIVYFFIDKIYVNLTPAELDKFKIVYIIVAVFSVVNFPFVTFNGILTAYEEFIPLKFADFLNRFLTVALMIIALLNGYGLYALVSVNAFSGLVTIAFKYIIIRKKLPVKARFQKNDFSLYKKIFKFSFWVTITAIAQRLIFNITPSILGIVASSSAIAVFGIVTTIEQYSYMITSAINGMFMPKISRIYAGTDKDKNIMPLMVKVGKFQFGLNALIVLGFLFLGREFIDLWVGKEYTSAYIGILLVIIPGTFFNSLQIANTAMMVNKKVKYQAYIAIIIGVFNLICSFIFSRYYGAMGACFSIFLAYSLRAVFYTICHQKVMGFDMKLFIKECYLKSIPSVLITLLSGFAINTIIMQSGWLWIGVKGILIVAVFGVSFFFTSISCQTRNSLFKKIRR